MLQYRQVTTVLIDWPRRDVETKSYHPAQTPTFRRSACWRATKKLLKSVDFHGIICYCLVPIMWYRRLRGWSPTVSHISWPWYRRNSSSPCSQSVGYKARFRRGLRGASGDARMWCRASLLAHRWSSCFVAHRPQIASSSLPPAPTPSPQLRPFLSHLSARQVVATTPIRAT